MVIKRMFKWYGMRIFIFGFCYLIFSNFIKAQINGVFSVGEGGDYETLDEPLDLIKKNGISGNVVLNLLPGTYTGHIFLRGINGLDRNSTLTFKAAEGKGTVLIQTLYANPTNYLIDIENCPYITFIDLEFYIGNQIIDYFGATDCNNLGLFNCVFRYSNSDSYRGNGTVKIKSSNHITIKNCYFSNSLVLNSVNHLSVDSSSVYNGYYFDGILTSTLTIYESDTVAISNTKIFEYGISADCKHLEINNSSFPFLTAGVNNKLLIVSNCNVWGGGISFEGTAHIINNKIKGRCLYNQGIDSEQCENCIIESNILTDISWHGINIVGSGIIRNNMIGGTWKNDYPSKRYAIQAKGDIQIYHNTISLCNATAKYPSAGIWVEGNNENIQNNIIAVNNPNSYAVMVDNIQDTFQCQNNIIYNLSGHVALMKNNEYYTLEQWIDSTGHDSLSKTTIPIFYSDKDLHLLDTAGLLKVPIDSLVLFDIDGEERTDPTFVGSDQFSCRAPSFINKDSYSYIETALENTDYQWIDCDNDYSVLVGDTNKRFYPEYNGNYAVRVISNLCDIISPCYFFDEGVSPVDTTNLTYNPVHFNLSIYPNPSHDFINIEYGDFQPVAFKILAYNGQVIKSIELNKNKINISDLHKGIYLLVIVFEDFSFTKHFIKY